MREFVWQRDMMCSISLLALSDTSRFSASSARNLAVSAGLV